MNKALITTKASALAEADLIKVLGDSLYPGAKPESIKMVLSYCQAAGLDPMMKPVHIVPMSVKKPGSREYEWRDVIMPGISLYRSQAAESGVYIGKTEPEFGPVIREKIGGADVAYPEWCKITVTRIVAGREASFTAKEYWLENYATAGKDTTKPNAMWAKRPFAQLAKCAEAQALRMAFPDRLGGQNTAEEMEGKSIDGMVDVTPKAPAATGKPADAKSQLDGFAGAKAKQADPKPGDEPEVDEIDPETGEVIPPELNIPKMPEDALAAFKSDGKWMAAWKWLASNLSDAETSVAQALAEEYREILVKVRAYNEKYADAVDNLLGGAGVNLE